MHPIHSLLLLSLLPLSTAADTILGAFIFHRHGDRTPKSFPPANLTSLGYSEVYARGTFYRNRYVASNAALKIAGLNTDIVKQSQISVSAPVDTVLQNSAQAFVQGLYPAVGVEAAGQKLRNGSTVQAPLDGYQLIPVGSVATGGGSEDNTWLQDASGCANAKTSSNKYFSSAEYQAKLASTKDYYSRLSPVLNSSFSEGDLTFKNAYVLFDVINVGEIHNSTIPGSDLLDADTLYQLRTLADAHEYGLAYNSSDTARAISGMSLAAEILQYLNSTITTKGAKKLGIQFGAYASFFSFFGLAQLPSATVDFTGVPDYASSMAFELFTTKDVAPGSFPAADDLSVRFLFHNGTSANSSEPTAYPLFGQQELAMPWKSFVDGMSKFAVGTTEEWCQVCGNTTGTCAEYASSRGSSGDSGSEGSGHHGISAAVGGVIGAMVTLAVILGLEALVLLLGGFRLSRKNKGAAAPMVENGNGAARQK